MFYLIVAFAVLGGLLTLTMVFYLTRHKCYPGFGVWTCGMCLVTAANALNSMRGVIPEAIPIIIGNTIGVTGVLLFYEGMRRFQGMPPMSGWWFGLPAVNLAACSFFYLVVDEPAQRIIWYAFATSVPLMLTAVMVFKRMKEESFVFYPVIAVEMCLICVLILARSVWFSSVPEFSFFMESHFQGFFFICMMSLQTLVTISFIMLNSERLQVDLLRAREELKEKIAETERYRSEIKVLSGLLPICSGCKKIRDEKGNWVQMETYIHARSEAEFSHGICPDCAKKYYPDYWDKV
jgi:hypothetical protein